MRVKRSSQKSFVIGLRLVGALACLVAAAYAARRLGVHVRRSDVPNVNDVAEPAAAGAARA